jgi:Asp-tRNA(Asn)/Glu-tRNA(Gln) amidotransferase A subunit family amidase
MSKMMRLHLRQIQRLERRVNAFTFIQQEAILEHQVTSLKDEGLSGQCIAIKDNISVKGWPMTCASRTLQGTPPSLVYDA